MHLITYGVLMDWKSAKEYCSERNWQWSLEVLNQAQKEMEELEDKVTKLEENYQKLKEKFHS